ncbi:MAG: hypothetical protein KAU36_05335, partial [candidate division Zixibacteria bacterium]|nr:hypothetical protein [candidate division Zixibacteria bacterium]
IETTDHPDENRRVELATPNLNFGLETRLYLDRYRRAYMSFWVKYNIVNFDTRAGTDLSGNTVTAGVTMGCFSMGKVNETLQALNFFD